MLATRLVPEPTVAPAWAELVALEPKLLALEYRVRAVSGRGRRFCANAFWYGYGRHSDAFTPSPKDRLTRLAGWFRAAADGPDLLRSRAAYDVAYRHLYSLLPPCRDCACL